MRQFLSGLLYELGLSIHYDESWVVENVACNRIEDYEDVIDD